MNNAYGQTNNNSSQNLESHYFGNGLDARPKPEFVSEPSKFVCFMESFINAFVPFSIIFVAFILASDFLDIPIEPLYMYFLIFIVSILIIIFMLLSYNKNSNFKYELYDDKIVIQEGRKPENAINYVFITSINYSNDFLDKIFGTSSVVINDVATLRHIKNAPKLLEFINYLYQYNMQYYRR